MAKIIIDPGHGGSDSGAVFGTRREKDDVLRLALAVGNLLQEKHQDVTYTRVTDIYHTPYEKAAMANHSESDIFLSLHRNAASNTGAASGAEALVYEDTGVASQIAGAILNRLEEAGFANRGIIERPNLAVLRRTEMPAVLIEVGYIDNDKDNHIFDENFKKISEAIAQGVLDTMEDAEMAMKQVKRNPVCKCPPDTLPPLYRVQVAAFQEYQNAARFLNKLQSEGYPAFMLYQDGIYKIQVGAYQLLDNAIRMEQRLRGQGYNTFITAV